MIKGHGGNIHEAAEKIGCSASDIIDMSSNLNPLGPPEGLSAHLSGKMDAIISLPEVDAAGIIEAVADEYGVSFESVLAGNGTTQFIYTIPQALESRRALIVGPTYADYRDACIMYDVEYDFHIAEEERNFVPGFEELTAAVAGYDTIFICNPDNPTGALIPVDEIRMLAEAHPDKYFIIDESYLPFVKEAEKITAVRLSLPNIIVLNSMSKIFRIPGLRVGFLIAEPTVIDKFEKFRLPWSVNALAQEAVLHIAENKPAITRFLSESRDFFEAEKALFMDTMAGKSELKIYPSATYFMTAKLPERLNAQRAWDFLLEEKILIRNCDNFVGLSDRFVRFSLKSREINLKLAKRLLELC